MKCVSIDIEGFHLFIGDLDPLRVLVFVKHGIDEKPLSGSGVGDQVHHDLVAGERNALPVQADGGEETVLYLVPLAGSRREMAHPDRTSDLVGKGLELFFSEAGTVSITASSIGGDDDLLTVRVDLLPSHVPAATDAFHGKGGRIVVGAHVDPSFVLLDVVDAVGGGLAQILVRKVVVVDLHRLSLGLPGLAGVLVVPDQFLLLCVDRENGVPGLHGRLRLGIDEAELGISVRVVLLAFQDLIVDLEAVSKLVQKLSHFRVADRISLFLKRGGQRPQALCRPFECRPGRPASRDPPEIPAPQEASGTSRSESWGRLPAS